MKLIFERSVPGRRCSILPACDVEETPLPESLRRAEAPVLPELSEQDLSRHYTELNHHVHGVNCGFYPLGSCTMKYNPRINEEMAALPGFTGIHPLAPAHTVQGCRRVLELAQQYLCEITGMDGMTFQRRSRLSGQLSRTPGISRHSGKYKIDPLCQHRFKSKPGPAIVRLCRQVQWIHRILPYFRR